MLATDRLIVDKRPIAALQILNEDTILPDQQLSVMATHGTCIQHHVTVGVPPKHNLSGFQRILLAVFRPRDHLQIGGCQVRTHSLV